MREIKFRAWDKKNEQMIRFGEGTRYSIHFDGMIEEFRPALTNVPFPIKTHPAYFINKTEDFTPIQFTGLKDKNGKEIYEGDIVKAKFRYDTDKEDKPAKNDTKFTVEYKINPYSQYCGFNLFPSDFSTLEVIGNIYENPELLKESTNARQT